MQRKALWWRLRSLPLLTQPNEQDTKQKAQSSRGPESQRRLVQRGWQWFTGMLAIGRLVGPYLFSWFLAVLTGYGFRKSRIALGYVVLILAFAGAYWGLDLQHPQPFSFWQAIILSVTAFHGRVFSHLFNRSDPRS